MFFSDIRPKTSMSKRFESFRRFFERLAHHAKNVRVSRVKTLTQDGNTDDKGKGKMIQHVPDGHSSGYDPSMPARGEPRRAIDTNDKQRGGHRGAEETQRIHLKALVDSSTQPRASDPSNLFQGAHNFVVNNPVFLANSTTDPYMKRALERAMERLSEKAILDAELDSAARAPIPSCNPGTRHELRDRITSWLTDRNRDSSLLWLYGPAGAGKSAIAQTIAESRRERGLLGAAFFFSRPNNRNDPNRVVPSLVHQLAVAYPQYKQLVLHLLVEDPSILRKVPQIQFQKLITELLFGMKLEGAATHPILLLLDGLDECQGDDAQREFIDIIAEAAASAKTLKLPFVWLVTSRPEWQIVQTFSNHQCRREELRIDTEQAIKDVTKILHDGFAKIRKKYNDAFTEGQVWPSTDQLFAICSSASGLPVFASTVLRFVDDEEIGNPVARLDDCLSFLKGNLLPADSGNPLDPLHLLYWGILRTVHPRVLPTTALILMFIILKHFNGPARSVANVLFLDQATFYGSLRRLHSVLEIPSAEAAFRKSVNFRHASFGDFLKHILNSGGSFGMTTEDFHNRVEPCYQRWCRIKNDEFTDAKAWKSSFKSLEDGEEAGLGM